MAKLVFDIETTALPLEGFDEGQLEYLFRDAENLPDPAQQQARRAEIQRFFSLWPLTGQVVCIAMSNVDSFRSKVLFLAGPGKDGTGRETPLAAGIRSLRERSGASDGVLGGGRPLRIHHHVQRTRLRYSLYLFALGAAERPHFAQGLARLQVPTEPHCDLLEQLTFYGVSGRDGAARRFNLDFYCKAFGIPSPKSHGITGMDVGRLMAEGRARDVAEYCLGDVLATVKLYSIWKERLSGLT
jgi:hypothetical protein